MNVNDPRLIFLVQMEKIRMLEDKVESQEMLEEKGESQEMVKQLIQDVEDRNFSIVASLIKKLVFLQEIV